MQAPEHIADLLYKFLSGSLTTTEEEELHKWVNASPENRFFFNQVTDEEKLQENLALYHPEMRTVTERRIYANVQERIGNAPVMVPIHRIHFLKTAWVRYAAAIIIVIGIAAYLWNTQRKVTPAITKTENPVPVQNDAQPGGNRALLTLSDGSTIVLDSASTGQIASEGGSVVKKTKDGQVIYTVEETTLSQPVVYNTMSTPRGGQYQVALPDGSRVWLNAESSITYPVLFTGSERGVSMTGEVYFEVAKDARKPFRVKVGQEIIEVLGTHFNVHAYTDEPGIKTSLLEGSVKVAGKVLQPGEAFVNGKAMATNTEQDVAWTKGYFQFNRTPMEEVMRQFTRWYDMEVVYESGVPDIPVTGKIQRTLKLSQTLNVIKTLGVNYRIENKKLIVR